MVLHNNEGRIMTKDTDKLALQLELLKRIKDRFRWRWVKIAAVEFLDVEPKRGAILATWGTYARILSIALVDPEKNESLILPHPLGVRDRRLTIKVELEVVKRFNSDEDSPVRYVHEERILSIQSLHTGPRWFVNRIKTAIRRGRLLFHKDVNSLDGLLVQLLTTQEIGKIERELKAHRASLQDEIDEKKKQRGDMWRMIKFANIAQR
jgi:hypothetical protein